MIRVSGRIIYVDELNIRQLGSLMEMYENGLGIEVDTTRLFR